MDRIKNKKVTTNPFNKNDNKCFPYAATVALNHKEITKDLKRISRLKPFISKNYWERMIYPSEKYERNKSDKNNLRIAVNVLYALKEKHILPTFQNIT